MNRSRESNLSIAIRQTMTLSQLSDVAKKNNQPSEFTIKVANTLEEREAVFKLGYQVYLEKGFIKKNTNQWLIHNYDIFNQTVILIVLDRNKNIAGSLTLVFNEDGKLPVEKIYSDEIKFLKRKGEKLVEISRLVISHEYRNSKEVLLLLINYLMIYSYHVKKYSSLVIEVNPRHKNYYKSLLDFKEIGTERPCPMVQNAPAILLHLPLKQYQAKIFNLINAPDSNHKARSLYTAFLKPDQEALVAHYLKNQFKPISSEEKLYFGFTESGIGRVACV